MKMNEFVEIVKKSGIAGGNKKEIVRKLLKALEAKDAVSQSAMYGSDQNKSPSDSIIQQWLSEKSKPKTVRYFPNYTIENKENAHQFFEKSTKKDHWIELRDLFKEWHSKQKADEDFYINIDADDLYTFSTSFWRQFASFFESLRLWDDVVEPYPKNERSSSQSSIGNEILGVFKEKFVQYKVYEFIPKDIENIIKSLYTYYDIWNENTKLAVIHENDANIGDTLQKFKKMYCKWFEDNEYFVYCPATNSNSFWELKLPEKNILLKFNEDFNYDMMPTNEWLTGRFKYAIVTPVHKDEQFNEEELSWKECQGEIIIIAFNIPAKAWGCDDEGVFVSEGDPDNGGRPIIEDCYSFIDGILDLNSSIEEFMVTISEKILKKYKGIVFNDVKVGILYNEIEQY